MDRSVELLQRHSVGGARVVEGDVASNAVAHALTAGVDDTAPEALAAGTASVGVPMFSPHWFWQYIVSRVPVIYLLKFARAYDRTKLIGDLTCGLVIGV
jgi:hypothetical protein